MLSGRTCGCAVAALALVFVMPLPAQPLSNAVPQTIATQTRRVAFFLRKFTEVNMFILSSARCAGSFERLSR
jgi:hypothetical protein